MNAAGWSDRALVVPHRGSWWTKTRVNSGIELRKTGHRHRPFLRDKLFSKSGIFARCVRAREPTDHLRVTLTHRADAHSVHLLGRFHDICFGVITLAITRSYADHR